MDCPKCGRANPDDVAICLQCGTQLTTRRNRSRALDINTYLPHSILAAVFCCQPLGIVAIVYSAMAESKKSSGDFDGAEADAEKAKQWLGWAFGLGLVWVLIVLLFMTIRVVH